jgi:GTPase SAR1 family protein
MYLITLIIIGNTSVGKTSLLVRYYENNFIPEQKTTVGVDYKAKEIDIDGEVIKMQVRKQLILYLII